MICLEWPLFWVSRYPLAQAIPSVHTLAGYRSVWVSGYQTLTDLTGVVREENLAGYSQFITGGSD